MTADYQPGDRVRLLVPENPRLHRASATIDRLAAWGAHVHCSAAATGCFRALWEEMEPEPGNPPLRFLQGYTGDMCDLCGSTRLRRSGSCAVCEDCGTTSGCS